MARSTGRRPRLVRLVVIVIGVVVLLYSVLIADQVLAGVGLLVSLFVLSLFYRLVRAQERIAAALEAGE